MNEAIIFSNQEEVDQRPFPTAAQQFLPPHLLDPLTTTPSPRDISTCLTHLSTLLDAVTSHLPASLVKWVADHPTPGLANGRFVQGTLLFADISGFTAMSERLSQNGREGAEEITTIVNRYFDAMLTILKQYDGQLIRFGGDALLGLFEEKNVEADAFAEYGLTQNPFAQSTQPNSPTRAVVAALKMQRAMAQFAHTQTSQGHFPLQMSVGIHHGRFFAAQLGDAISMEYALFGTAVNQTAAIESAACAGEVALDRQTFERVDPTLLCTSIVHPKNPEYLIVEGNLLPDNPPPPPPLVTHFPLPPTIESLWQLVTVLEAYTPYLPVGLLPRFVSGDTFQGEHRLVATLFANVGGLSEMVDALGPENTETIVIALNSYFLAMSTAVAQFGGVINKIDLYDHGEKLLITFGAPIAHEDDAERAARAALEMKARLPTLHKTLIDQTGLTKLKLSQRIGISFGTVYAGFVGASWRHEYTVMGDQVNLAARLMSQATKNSIVVSSSVSRRLQGMGEITQLGEVKLKGKANLVPIYELTAVQSTSHLRRSEPANSLPLVGRQQEMNQLNEMLTQLQQGQGGVTAVIGDAGIGKSRLLEEASATQWPHRASCLSYAETTPYSLMQEVVRQLLGLEDGRSLTDALTTLWSQDEMVLQRPYVAHFLNHPLTQTEQEKIRYLDGEGLRQRTFITLRALFEQIAIQQPTLIWLDDLQWIDTASLDLLTYLLPLSHTNSLLWLLSFRPDHQKGIWSLHESQATTETYATIHLSGLDEAKAIQMVTSLLGEMPLSPALASLLLSRADGNPLYLEEVVRSLMDEGMLCQDKEGHWHLTRAATHFTVPDTLEGVLMARLDRLPLPSRHTIQVAAIIGRIFPFDVLKKTSQLPQPKTLRDQLSQLQKVEMIEENQPKPEQLYSFLHTLLQEVTYRSQAVTARRTVHRRIALYLENGRQRGWGDVEDLPSLIAQHAYVGQDWPRALRYQMQTGERSMTLFANQEAIDHYKKALESAHKLPEEDTAVQRLNIHLSLGQIYITTDQYEDATHHLDAAEGLVGQLDDSGAFVAVCRWRTRLHELRGEYEDAFTWIERGLAQNVNSSDVPQIMLLAGLIRIRQGRYEDALRYCHTVLELANKQDEVTAVARANNLLGITHLRSDSQQAITHFQTAFGLYQQAGDVQGQATSHNLIANACFNLGRWTDAEYHYQQALTMFKQLDDTYNRIMAVNNLGGIALNRGNLKDALTFYTEGLALAHQIGGSAWMMGVFEMNLGATYVRQKQPADALRHLKAGEAYFEKAGSRDFLPELYRHWAATLMLKKSHWQKASVRAQQALALAKEQQNQGEMGSCKRLLGELLLAMGDVDTAVATLQQSISLLESVGEAYELARSRYWLARALWQQTQSADITLPSAKQAQKTFAQLGAALDLTAVSQFIKHIQS